MMYKRRLYYLVFLDLILPILFIGRGLENKKRIENSNQNSKTISSTDILIKNVTQNQPQMPALDGMVWISDNVFKLGTVDQDKMAMKYKKATDSHVGTKPINFGNMAIILKRFIPKSFYALNWIIFI